MFRLLLLLVVAGLSASTFDPELHAKYLELPYDQFMQHFNAQNYSWKITQYPHLNNRQLFGAQLSNGSIEGIEVIHHDSETIAQLPKQFDAREKWPHCQTIKEIYDQGHCGSCWAFGTTTVASDRTCIHKGLNVRLSEQDFNCFMDCICEGGSQFLAFMYWIADGIVTQECKPYNITESKQEICCSKACNDRSMSYYEDKHFGEKFYVVPENNDDIMAELVNNGPIVTGFTVFADFINYTSGIYEHMYGDKRGGHAVRVIGYGEEGGIGYWLVANSWGEGWGEGGFFKIKRNQPLLGFETDMSSGLPK